MPNGRTKAPIHALGLLHVHIRNGHCVYVKREGFSKAIQVGTLINVLHTDIRTRDTDEHVNQP